MSKRSSNRKSQKLRFIRAKNLMRMYPECAADGFYCNHIYDPEHPWQWVDFRFFHPNRPHYFAVALTTCAYRMLTEIDDRVAEEHFSELGTDAFSPESFAEYRRKLNEVIRTTDVSSVIAKPYLEIHDYDRGITGVWASVNSKHLNAEVIKDFIAEFAKAGYPTTPGIKNIKSEERLNFDERIFSRV